MNEEYTVSNGALAAAKKLYEVYEYQYSDNLRSDPDIFIRNMAWFIDDAMRSAGDNENQKLLWDTLTSCRELLQGHSHNKPEARHRMAHCVLCSRQKSVCANIDLMLADLRRSVHAAAPQEATQ